MSCSAIMTANPATAHEEDTIGAATQRLLEKGYVNLPVTNSEGKLIGLFGIYDLLALLVPRVAMIGDLVPNLRFLSDDAGELRRKYDGLKTEPVSRALNREPVTVHPDTPVIEAIRLFCREHSTLPVIEPETNKLVGIVSHWDALRFLMGQSK